jgi:hypothetical protein
MGKINIRRHIGDILVKKNIEAAQEIADNIRRLVDETNFGEIKEGIREEDI